MREDDARILSYHLSLITHHSENPFHPAAVHDDGLARDVGGALGGEEGDRGGYLFGPRHAPHGDFARPAFYHLLLRLAEARAALSRVLLLPRRESPAGRDVVDGQAVGRDLVRERLGPAREPGPHRVREQQPVYRLLDGDGRDVYDAPPAARAHEGDGEPREPYGRERVQLERAAVRVEPSLLEDGAGRAASVRHEHV